MKKLLIVDDVKLLVSMERSMLSRQNLQLLTANSGPEAIAIHRKERVDLILLDLDMPGMNGDEVCKIIRTDDSFNPVIIIMVISGPSQKDIERCVHAGANDYLSKPINVAELLNKIGKYLYSTRRQYIRVKSRLGIKAVQGELVFSANTIYISEGGMLIESTAMISDIKEDDSINFSMFLPESANPINIIGTIISKVGNGKDKMLYYGVKFIDVAEQDRTFLEKHIERKLARTI